MVNWNSSLELYILIHLLFSELAEVGWCKSVAALYRGSLSVGGENKARKGERKKMKNN